MRRPVKPEAALCVTADLFIPIVSQGEYMGEIKGGMRPSMKLVVMGIINKNPKRLVHAHVFILQYNSTLCIVHINWLLVHIWRGSLLKFAITMLWFTIQLNFKADTQLLSVFESLLWENIFVMPVRYLIIGYSVDVRGRAANPMKSKESLWKFFGW